MLRKQYCENFGRPAKELEMMFANLLNFMSELKNCWTQTVSEEIRSKDHEDARFGRKAANSTFFGYKNHLTMSEERIITGIEVAHGGEPVCAQLPILLEKSLNNDIQVKEVIGDMAYVSEDYFDTYEEKNVTLLQKRTLPLHPWMRVFASTRTRDCCNARRGNWID